MTIPRLIFCTFLASIAIASHAFGGYRIDAVYTGEVFANVSGGVKRGLRSLDNIEMTLEVDIGKVLGAGVVGVLVRVACAIAVIRSLTLRPAAAR